MVRVLESEQFKENIYQLIEELLDLIGEYKAKRNLLEVDLKHNDDPARPEFYVYIARLGMLDVMIADLENLKRYLIESSDIT